MKEHKRRSCLRRIDRWPQTTVARDCELSQEMPKKQRCRPQADAVFQAAPTVKE